MVEDLRNEWNIVTIITEVHTRAINERKDKVTILIHYCELSDG